MSIVVNNKNRAKKGASQDFTHSWDALIAGTRREASLFIGVVKLTSGIYISQQDNLNKVQQDQVNPQGRSETAGKISKYQWMNNPYCC